MTDQLSKWEIEQGLKLSGIYKKDPSNYNAHNAGWLIGELLPRALKELQELRWRMAGLEK